MPPVKPQPKRCAVYTRKSSEEGLEQDFNSLQAQREACDSFILSQKAEGWRVVEAAYDDGGFSGGSMERPGLQRLLDDIRARRIDIVVVYKIDRLTRALTDFAKMVEVFDAHGVSFVAVTQQFNTTTSMGRLTLNILLSFAQFEREVTAERIRDKIAASKRKGMWMGGNVPLGYDAKDRSLVVNEAEAETVRFIFRRYLEIGSVGKLRTELKHCGIRSKARVASDGSPAGDKDFSRGALFAMLVNPVYIGEIRHGALRHPGRHPAIIDRDLWDRVQADLADRSPVRRGRPAHPSPLAGKVFDVSGERLTSTHANKHGKRYRYYVSRSLIIGTAADSERGWRLPAPDLERAVAQMASSVLVDQHALSLALTDAGVDIATMPVCLARAASLDKLLAGDPMAQLPHLVQRVEVAEDCLAVTLTLAPIVEGMGEAPTIVWTLPVSFQRRGVEMKLVIPVAAPEGKVDPALLKAIARARNWWADMVSGSMPSLAAIARREGINESFVGALLPLAFLAPNVVEAILAGRHPADLTAETLVKRVDLPLAWEDQRRLLGCG